MTDKLKLDSIAGPVVGKEARELAAEIIGDERAARERGASPWRREFDRMIEAIAVPPTLDRPRADDAMPTSPENEVLNPGQGRPKSEFEKLLDEAAERGRGRPEGKDGPRR